MAFFFTFASANILTMSLSLALSQKIDPFASSCSAAISSLQESISTLSNSGNLKTSEVRNQLLLAVWPSDLLYV